MLRLKTIRRLTGLGIVFVIVAIMLAVFFHLKNKNDARLAQEAQQAQAAAARQTQENAVLTCGPFRLEITTTQFGEQNYKSFSVYFINSETDEPIFSCGRMFPAGQVQSIAWSGTDYTILVTLKDGSKIFYTYDGSSAWNG